MQHGAIPALSSAGPRLRLLLILFPHVVLAYQTAEAKVHGNSPSIEWDLWLKSRAG